MLTFDEVGEELEKMLNRDPDEADRMYQSYFPPDALNALREDFAKWRAMKGDDFDTLLNQMAAFGMGFEMGFSLALKAVGRET